MASTQSTLQGIFQSLIKRVFASQRGVEPARPGSVRVSRAPRLRTELGEHLRNALFVSTPEVGAFGIRNLSLGGMALAVREGAAVTPQVGQDLEGRLKIHGSEYPVLLRISHVSSQMAGGPFLRTPPQFRERLFSQLAAEFQAAHVAPMRTELLKAEDDGHPIFFCGSEGTELKVVERDGKIVRFHMGFLGMYLEGNGEGRVQCGLIHEDHRSGTKPVYKGATLIGRPLAFNADTQMLASRFLVYVEGLDSRLRDQLLDILARAAR